MIVNLQMNMNRLPKILFALEVLSLSLVAPAAPIRLDEQSDEKSAATARIRIENFGKVNDRFYRGSLPKQSDYAGLVALGVMTAIYRMSVDGWDAQRAYAEMRRYGFYKRWGHGPLKAYVFDYYRQLQQEAAQSIRRD